MSEAPTLVLPATTEHTDPDSGLPVAELPPPAQTNPLAETPALLPTGEQPVIHEAMSDEALRQALGAQVVDISGGVVAHALDATSEHIDNQTTQHGFKGFVKKIWVGNYVRDFIHQRNVQKNRSAIIDSGNLYALHGGSEERHTSATEAIVERFENNWLQHGESNRELTETQQGSRLAAALRDSVRAYSRSGDEAALIEARTTALSTYGGQVRAADRNKGLLFADNWLKVARNAKAAADHGVGLDRIETALSLKSGEAQVGAQTEARFTAVDRAVDRVYKSKYGSLINETTLAVAAGLTMSAIKFATGRGANAVGATIGLGVGAGVVAGVREHYHFAQDRRTHIRQMEEGGVVDMANAKRRPGVEKTRYTTVQSAELISNLTDAAQAEAPDGAQLRSLIDAIGSAQTRMDMSADRKKGLIQYSSKVDLEQERKNIFLGLARAKVNVGRLLGSADEATLAAAGAGSRDINEVISARIASVGEAIEGNISERDKAARILQAKRTLAFGALGAVSSILVGEGIQKLTKLAADGAHRTLEAVAPAAGGVHKLVDINKHAAVKVPAGYHLVQHDGKWQFVGANNKVLDGNVTFDHDGQLSEATRHALTEKGFGLSDQLHHTTIAGTTETVTRTQGEYMRAHPDRFTTVHRELWYDNNTPNVYDHNELKLDWGGVDGSGLDEHGNYVFNVSGMLPNGSFHDGLSANAQQLIKEGKLQIALTGLHDHQQHDYMYTVNKQGNVIINKHSFEGRSLFSHDSKHAEYDGAFAEADQNMGVHNGVENVRMLATVVGNNKAHAAKDIIHHAATRGERLVTTINPPEAAVAAPDEIPLILPIPVYGRTGLEALTEKKNLGLPEEVTGMYYGGRSLEELQRWIAQDPARLRTRREIIDPDGTHRWVEVDGSSVERSVTRERETLRVYLDSERTKDSSYYQQVELAADAMAPMDPECRVTVNVPSWMEAGNLKNFLQQYTHQIDHEGTVLKPELYEINVLVNRKAGTSPDNSVEVINEFIAEFESNNGFRPKVNYHDVELNPPNNNVGYARKLLTDAVMLRSLRRDTQEASLYIETEDADMVRIDPRTVSNLINKFDRNPQLDAVRGIQDRSPQYMKNNDMLFIRRRAADFLEIMARSKKLRNPNAPNWNFTWNRVVTGGWNTGYSAEAYGMIDGYEPTPTGEDMSIGEKITMVRGDGTLPNLEVVGIVGSRSDSSPRRFIEEIASQQGAYSDFESEDTNARIREQSVEEAMEGIKQYARIDDANQAEFAGYINFIASWAQTLTPNQAESAAFTKRLLFWLGFQKNDYTISEEGVQVNNWANLKGALNNYRRRYAEREARAPIPAAA